jgi:hypothetical protein
MPNNAPKFLAALALAAPATAQDTDLDGIREELSRYVAGSDVGAGYAQIINMFIDPSISLSRLEIDDDGAGGEFDIAKLPMHWELPSGDQTWRLTLRGLLSHSSFKDTEQLIPGETIDSDWRADSGMIGLGLSVPWSDHWYGVVIAEAGISHLENKADYNGPGAQAVGEIVDGILLNWKSYAAIYDLRLGADYIDQPTRNRGISIKTRYSFAHTASFGESRDFPSFEENTHVISALGEYRHPWGFSIGEFPVFGIVSAGGTAFLGHNRDALGFTQFYQAGYSLALDISKRNYWIKSLSLGYQWNQGKDVSGQSILFSWEIN